VAQHFHQLAIKDIRQETPDCVSIAFDIPPELEEAYRFTQGQNITIRWKAGNEEIRRSYSICSSPLENELRVAVKKVADGRFSQIANTVLKAGDVLEVFPPTGNFHTPLKGTQRKRYLAFAAGSGITPVLSLVKTTLAVETGSHFTLVYGNRDRSSIIFKEALEALKNRYLDRFTILHVLSREKTDAPVNHGRINAEKCETIAGLIHVKTIDEFFLCGPEAMIFSVREWLYSKGVPAKNVHFELFTTPGQAVPGEKPPIEKFTPEEGKISSVTITLDGISFDLQLAYGGEAILDAALKTGADLPYACKGGVCSTCRAKLLQGEVEMDISAGFD
jgi:ring-1,2-phenylacetyl-CoA epoxidase subunit PaaE